MLDFLLGSAQQDKREALRTQAQDEEPQAEDDLSYQEQDLECLVSLDLVDEAEFEEMVSVRELQALLWDACKAGRLGVLARVLGHSAFTANMLESVEPETGRGALHMASSAGSEPCVRMLLRSGADSNRRTAESAGWKSALHVAALAGHWQCCRALLVRGGARIDARTPDGRTALHLAAEADSPHTVAELLRHAKHLVEARDNDGRSPLHLACAAASLECSRLLIQAGAERAASDVAGRSPLDVATVAHAKPKLLKLLKEPTLIEDTDAPEEEEERLDEETLKWCWLLVDDSGKMVETRSRRVALFRSVAEAWQWATSLPADDASLKTPSSAQPFRLQRPKRQPARVKDVGVLLRDAPCERVEVEKHDAEDRAWADFLKRAKLAKEKGQSSQELDALEQLRDAQKAVAELRTKADEAQAEVDMHELALVSLFASCQRLEAAIQAHEAALCVSPKGPTLLATARKLADAHHPAARDDADPARYAAACAALLNDSQFKFADFTADAKLPNKTHVGPTAARSNANNQRTRNTVMSHAHRITPSPPPELPASQTDRPSPPAGSTQLQELPLEHRQRHKPAAATSSSPPELTPAQQPVATAPTKLPETPVPPPLVHAPDDEAHSRPPDVSVAPLVDAPPESRTNALVCEQRQARPAAVITAGQQDDDHDEDDDVELLRELEHELAAAGVRRHAKAARLLHDEEITWSQLRAVFALSGPDGIKRTLGPLGLTAGALASIEIRLTSLNFS